MKRTQRNAAITTNRHTLEDLFSPPLDLICRGTLKTAKEEGQRLNKWLMVDIQNHQEFSCRVLNRDVWSNSAVKSIISEHFIFWQTYHHNNEGHNFMHIYNVVDFPYVAILDPRTGDIMRCWTVIDRLSFCDLVTDFLHDLPAPSGTTLCDEIEEMQLKAAIAASLQEVGEPQQNANNQFNNDINDSDLATFESDTEENKINSNEAQTKTLKQSNALSNAKESGVESSTLSNCNSQPLPLQQNPNEIIEDYRLYLGPEKGLQIHKAGAKI